MSFDPNMMQQMFSQFAEMMASQQAPSAKVDSAAEQRILEMRQSKLDALRAESKDAAEALENFLEVCGFADNGDLLLQLDKIGSNAAYSYFSARAALERSAMYEVSRPSGMISNGVESLGAADQAAMDSAERQASMKARCEAALKQYFAAQRCTNVIVTEMKADQAGRDQLDNLIQYLRAPSIDATDEAYHAYANKSEQRRTAQRAVLQGSAKQSASALLWS